MGASSTYGSWLWVAMLVVSLSGFIATSLWLFIFVVPSLPSMFSLLHPAVGASSTSLLLLLVLYFPCSFDMERGSSSRRGRGGTSRRPRTRSGFRLVDAVESSVDTYHFVTPPEIQTEMDLAEADVHVLRRFIPDDEVRETTSSWVPDTGTFRGWTSQYLKTMDIYWHLKTLMGQVLLDHHEARQEVLLQLDDVQLQVKLVDHKLNLIADKLAGMDLSNLDYAQAPSSSDRRQNH
jgi:hypothetical protein